MLDTTRINLPDASAATTKPRGAHPDKRLTAVTVRNLKQPGRYADGNGLYLFVDDSGAKRWLLRIVINGRRRDIGLGCVRLVSLADARDEAARMRRKARDGEDPLAERRRTSLVVPTFREGAATVHAAHAATFKNQKHKAQWLASLKTDVFSVLGDLRVSAIETADVLKTLSPVWTTKPETARRLKLRIRAVMDWAKASGFRSGDNPVYGSTQVLPKVRPATQHHAALPYVQVPFFIQALHSIGANKSTKLAFEFLILTATRTSEVLGAAWDEIDREAKTWTIPAQRIKAGREHRIPLSKRCLEILDRAEALANDRAFVFRGRSATAPLSNMVFLMMLRRMEREDITAHGFRSAFRDWSAEKTRFPRSVCEAALAHVVTNKTEAAYFRTDLFDKRRALMNDWEQFATSKSASVLTIRR